MNQNRITTRRKHAPKTLHARLFNKARTRPRKQRASATAASSSGHTEDAGINVARALTIIFAIHVVGIAMIFIHKHYLSGRTEAPVMAAAEQNLQVYTEEQIEARPKLSNGDLTVLPKKGDNYATLAKRYHVDEADLRNANMGIAIRPGGVLRIPQQRRIVAEKPPEVAAYEQQRGATPADQGLVEIKPANSRRLSPSNRDLQNAPRAEPVTSGRTHVIKSGENIWRISNKYKVSQKEVMSLNNISDPTKLKIGQVIKLP